MAAKTFAIKTGDRLPSIAAALTRDGAALDLTEAVSVRFTMRAKGATAHVIDAPAVIVSAAGGIVAYEWGAGETDVAGVYEGEFVVTWDVLGREQTFPPDSYLAIRFYEDLETDV